MDWRARLSDGRWSMWPRRFRARDCERLRGERCRFAESPLRVGAAVNARGYS